MDQDDTTHFGFRRIPVAEKASQVARVFGSVASRYDIMNDLMSLGTHRLMKQIAVEFTAARTGQVILDLAGGTGDLTRRLARAVGSSGQVVLCDINDAMLHQGRDRLIDDGVTSNVSYVQADAELLPFHNDQFDSIMIGFGLRNFTNKQRAIETCHHALRPSGRLVILEFSKPKNAVVKTLYDGYSKLWPRIGEIVTGNRDSYQYLVESIKMHPPQEELLRMLEAAGFAQVKYHNLLNGVVAIHIGRKEASDATC